MFKLKIFFLISAFSIILCSEKVVFAGYPSTQDFLVDCVGANKELVEGLVANAYCLGYVDGIIDASEIISSGFPESKGFCLPKEGISAGKAVDVVVLYIMKNPESKTSSARLTVIMALNSAYPCL